MNKIFLFLDAVEQPLAGMKRVDAGDAGKATSSPEWTHSGTDVLPNVTVTPSPIFYCLKKQNKKNYKKQELPRWTFSCVQSYVLLGSRQVLDSSNGPIVPAALEDTGDLQGAGLFWSHMQYRTVPNYCMQLVVNDNAV